MRSPLGSADQVARVRDEHPTLAPLIDELQEMVGPEYDRANERAIAAQAKLDRSRRIAMVGTAVAALASVLHVVPNENFRLAASVLVVVSGAVAAAAFARGRERTFREWTEQRRIAEEMRSLYFRRLALDDPGGEATERRLALAEQITAITFGGTSDVSRPATVAPGDPLADERAAVYGTFRLNGQIEWMRNKAAGLRVWAARLDGAQTGLTIAIPLLGVVGIISEQTADGAVEVPAAAIASAIVSGAAAAIGAASASLGHDRLAAHYERTVADLERYRRVWLGSRTDGLVEAIEQTLMREHRAWHELTEDIERAGS